VILLVLKRNKQKNNSGFNYEKSRNWQEQQNHTLPRCFALIMCLSLIIARDSALPDLLKSKITFWTVSNTSYMVTKGFHCLWASTNYLTIQLLVHYTNNFVKLQRWKYYTLLSNEETLIFDFKSNCAVLEKKIRSFGNCSKS